jgi:hypothetical protein
VKTYLMKKFGPILGLIALAGIVLGFTFAPSSCTMTPEQQKRLQAISVPAASILSTVAVSKGWIEPGDKITIQRGVAVVTSTDSTEAKLFALAELGITEALKNGLVEEGDVITLENTKTVSILAPSTEGPLTIPFGDLIGGPDPLPEGPLNPLLPKP